ncbi:isoprenoid biosynthesis enzyme family protein [Anditalea andensis]|uniref:Cyclic nucleotide-binding domain-containing protein n=1 Tax=Anditalea andensis TaxID=1048983 RepID=A0A074KVT9_9BACT|nr:hypothetical protein [Anditalea andensis]KEO71708.1 hypothetical protein EL17_23190 [Anditalea andensis]
MANNVLQYMMLVKPAMDALLPLDIRFYRAAAPFLEVSFLGHRSILMKAGEKEKGFRYIVKGLMGRAYEGKLQQLYFQGQLPFDRDAYFSGAPGMHYWESIGSTVMLHISGPAKQALLDQVPEFVPLFKKLLLKAAKDDRDWANWQRKHHSEAYPQLIKMEPSLRQLLHLNQLASLMNISRKTFSRYLSSADRTGALPRKARLRIAGRQHPWAGLAHDEVTGWLADIGLLSQPDEQEKFRKQGLSLLPANIYPDISFRKLLVIAKLYALLHLMEKHSGPDHEQYWQEQRNLFLLILQGNTGAIIPSPAAAFRLLWDLGYEAFREEALRQLGVLVLAHLEQRMKSGHKRDMDACPCPPDMGPLAYGLVEVVYGDRPAVWWEIWHSLNTQKKHCLQYLELLDTWCMAGIKAADRKDKKEITAAMAATAARYLREEVKVIRYRKQHIGKILQCFAIFRNLMAGSMEWYMHSSPSPN